MLSLKFRLLTLLAAGFGVGCGDGRPPRYPVSGTVSFESGEPVRNATIEFLPETATPSPRGQIDSEGRFSLSTYTTDDGAPAGEYRVVVVQTLVSDSTKHLGKLGEQHASHRRGVEMVAAKHASPDSSGLRAEVSPTGPNELSIVVEAY